MVLVWSLSMLKAIQLQIKEPTVVQFPRGPLFFRLSGLTDTLKHSTVRTCYMIFAFFRTVHNVYCLNNGNLRPSMSINVYSTIWINQPSKLYTLMCTINRQFQIVSALPPLSCLRYSVLYTIWQHEDK